MAVYQGGRGRDGPWKDGRRKDGRGGSPLNHVVPQLLRKVELATL